MKHSKKKLVPSKRIVVVAGTSLNWREKVLRGIASYAHEHGPWHIYSAPQGTENAVFEFERYEWDGLIVRLTSGQLRAPHPGAGNAGGLCGFTADGGKKNCRGSGSMTMN